MSIREVVKEAVFAICGMDMGVASSELLLLSMLELLAALELLAVLELL